MEGSVYQRKDGRWVGAVDIGLDASGKRKRKNVYGKTKKEVQINLNNLIYELQNNIYRDPGQATVKSFLREWYKLNADKWAETTAALYDMYITKHIIPVLGNVKLKDILPMHIENFYNIKLKESSSNTVVKYHKLLHKAFEHARRNKLILTNPVDELEKPKAVKYNPKVYNEKQFAELLDHVKGTFDEIPILLAGVCGLRRGEIFGLRWSDVDFINKTITIAQTHVRFNKNLIKNPKTAASARTFSAPEVIFPVLDNYRKSGDIINIDPNGLVCDKYKPGSYSERFSKIVDRFELPHIRLHDLRHYNAVIMMKYNVPDKVAAQRLGQSGIRTLRDVYQHVQTDMDEEAARKKSGLFINGVQ